MRPFYTKACCFVRDFYHKMEPKSFRSTVMPIHQLTINQRKCNAALIVITDDHVILQKNSKPSTGPEWAAAGGKVDEEDQEIVEFYLDEATGTSYSHLSAIDATKMELVRFLYKQFQPYEATKTVFAYAALREAVEEIGGKSWKFITEAILSKQATLVRVDRDSYGIPEANKNYWTEIFYLDFGDLPVDVLMANLTASKEKDCERIVAARISDFASSDDSFTGKTVTLYSDDYEVLPVRHTVAVVAKRVQELHERIEAIAAIDCKALLLEGFESELLQNLDCQPTMCKFFLPRGAKNKPANWIVILGNYNGQAKFSLPSGSTDEEFSPEPFSEADWDCFELFEYGSTTDCFAHDTSFNANSGKQGTDGRLECTFLVLETIFASKDIANSLALINQIVASKPKVYPELFQGCNYFVQVPYLKFQEALIEGTPLSCTDPDGKTVALPLYEPEQKVLLKILPQFDAKRIKMIAQHTTPHLASSLRVDPVAAENAPADSLPSEPKPTQPALVVNKTAPFCTYYTMVAMVGFAAAIAAGGIMVASSSNANANTLTP
jgi:8-oxo-dGTP pyrophosphatase MutT (NUDIX family)